MGGPRARQIAVILSAMAVAVPLAAAAGADPQADQSHSGLAITRVVMAGKKATFTHEGRMPPGQTAQLRVNLKGGINDAFLSTLVLEPDHELFVVPSTGMDKATLTQLLPDFVTSDDTGVDLKGEELWKHLLGKPLTLIVEHERDVVKLDAALQRHDQASTLTGNLQRETKPHDAVCGKLLGFGKSESSGPIVLKLLVDDAENQVIPIPVTAIAAIRFDGTLADDLQRVAKLLETHACPDRRLLTIKRVPEGMADEPASITYEQETKHSWKVRLSAKGDPAGTAMAVEAWAEIWNETPYPWNRVTVILKSDAGEEYLLRNVDLQPWETGRFPLVEPPPDVHTERVVPKHFTLSARQRLAIVLPTTDSAKNQELPCVNYLVLTNGGPHSIPAGGLAAYDPKGKRLSFAEIEELRASSNGRKKEVKFPLAPNRELQATYNRNARLQPIALESIHGRRVRYLQGYLSTLDLKVKSGQYPSVKVTVVTDKDPLGQSLTMSLTAPQQPTGRGSASPLRELQIINTPAADSVILTVTKARSTNTSPCEDRLILREDSKSQADRSVECDIEELPSDVLVQLNRYTSCDIRSQIQDLIVEKNELDSLKNEIDKLLDQLHDLETSRRGYAAQPQSSSHGPILRDLASRIQRHEAEIAARRDELARKRYQFDHYVAKLHLEVSEVRAADNGS